MRSEIADWTDASAAYDISELSNTPRQRRSQELTLRVLRAAEEIVRSVGYNGLTVAAVAERADVSVGGLYGRFKSRDEIIHAVHQHFLRNMQLASSEWSKCAGQSLDETIQRFICNIISFFRDYGSLIPRYGNALPVQVRPSVVKTEECLCENFICALAYHADELPLVDTQQVARLVIHFVFASAVRESVTDMEDTSRRITWPILFAEMPEIAISYVRRCIQRASSDKAAAAF